jgi:phosphoribosylaminoimidazolecarboxamide formyltransferase/IMP cyclohydrolase
VVDALIAEGKLQDQARMALAAKAFSYTSYYDYLIARYLNYRENVTPEYLGVCGRKSLDLRYGENPHQKAALYTYNQNSPLSKMEKIQGKKLSFNNILDLSMVYEVINCFKDHKDFCVIVKHQNPCGAAGGDIQSDAFQRALAGDPKSAFGGIVGFNQPLTAQSAEKIKDIFFEVIVAPDFTPDALELLRKKKKLRLVKIPLGYVEEMDLKIVPGGFVFQERDNFISDSSDFELQTSREVTAREKEDIHFGWKLIKYVKSNGIIIVKDQQLIGVGAGQMSRVDAVELSIKKSQFSLKGAVLVSDAFFPFADSIETAAKHNISVVVEPGGSIRDDKVIAAAKENNISLLFTGVRHFKH